MTNCWFAGQVSPDDPRLIPGIPWRAYLQTGNAAARIETGFRSREDCERFIRDEVLGAEFDDATRRE